MSATEDDVPIRTVEFTFDDTSCLRPLRRTIREMLAGAEEDARVDAELVATELVANALEHAEGPRSVQVVLTRAGKLHITVVDGSPEAQLTIGASRLGTHRGRGLSILEATSLWSVTRNATSKSVWAVLTIGGSIGGSLGGGGAATA